MNKNKRDKIMKIIKSMDRTHYSQMRPIFIDLKESTGRAFFEIQDSFSALGFFKLLEKDPEVEFDDTANVLKFSAPLNYYWKTEIMSKAKELNSTLFIWWIQESNSPHSICSLLDK